MGDAGCVARDALLGGRERIPIGRGGRGRRRWGKGSPRSRWPGSGGRRWIGALVVIEGELGTRATGRLRPIERGELEGAEILVGRVVPGAGNRGRGGLGGRVRVGGRRGAEGRGGGWLGWVGKGVDWWEEDVLVEGGGRLLVEGGRIGRGLGVCAHPAEVVRVGWEHRGRREVVAGGGSGATRGWSCRGRCRSIQTDAAGRRERQRQRRQRTDGRQRRWRRRRGRQRRGWISQSSPRGERQSDRTDRQQPDRQNGIIHSKLA